MTDVFIHPTSVVDDGAVIGEGTVVWHFCHVQSGARIGRDCMLAQNVYVAGNVTLGDGVRVQNNVSLYDGVTVEDDVFLGPSCVFTNDRTPRARFPKGGVRVPTRVCAGASVGANATIVCGCTIGRCAMIGAGAVVTGDVPDHALMTGVPARQTGWVCRCGEPLRDLSCPACQRRYQFAERGLIER